MNSFQDKTLWQNWLIVIPARMGSTRLSRKPLQTLGGKALIVRVYERVAPLAAEGASIVVATDHEEIMQVLHEHSIAGVMTAADHPSGTDRVLEAARHSQHPFIMNVQGDEPFVHATDLRNLAKAAAAHSHFEMGTLIYKSRDRDDFQNPSVVKCVRSLDHEALYFSRSPLPYYREGFKAEHGFWHHLGVYAFARQSLERFCQLPPSLLEESERLEQLRALEHGISILTVQAEHRAQGIDTPEDLHNANVRYTWP